LATCDVFQIDEVIPVFNRDGSFGEVHRFAADVLIPVFHFEQAGVWAAVRRDEAVAAKIVIAGRAGGAKVAAESPEGFVKPTGFLIMRGGQWLLNRAQTLIDPIPNETALQVRFVVNLIPIRTEI